VFNSRAARHQNAAALSLVTRALAATPARRPAHAALANDAHHVADRWRAHRTVTAGTLHSPQSSVKLRSAVELQLLLRWSGVSEQDEKQQSSGEG